MAHTFCYCLTTDGADSHAASTLMSAMSLRRQHADACVVLVTDADSARALEDRGHPLLGCIDEIVRGDVPEGRGGMRNRYLKTLLPQMVRRDFLYLDGDTLIVRPLDEVFAADAPVAAGRNHNSTKVIEPEFAIELDAFTRCGWAVGETPYVNGGVLMFRDDPEVRAFSDLWHRKWQQSSANGKHFDQPALNSALWDSGIKVHLLPHAFNAQIHVRPRTAAGAHLWHIYASARLDRLPRTRLDALVNLFLARGEVSPEAVADVCTQPHPWLADGPLDALMLRRLLKRQDYLQEDSVECIWLSGRRRAAVAYAVQSARARVHRFLHPR